MDIILRDSGWYEAFTNWMTNETRDLYLNNYPCHLQNVRETSFKTKGGSLYNNILVWINYKILAQLFCTDSKKCIFCWPVHLRTHTLRMICMMHIAFHLQKLVFGVGIIFLKCFALRIEFSSHLAFVSFITPDFSFPWFESCPINT